MDIVKKKYNAEIEIVTSTLKLRRIVPGADEHAKALVEYSINQIPGIKMDTDHKVKLKIKIGEEVGDASHNSDDR